MAQGIGPKWFQNLFNALLGTYYRGPIVQLFYQHSCLCVACCRACRRFVLTTQGHPFGDYTCMAALLAVGHLLSQVMIGLFHSV